MLGFASLSKGELFAGLLWPDPLIQLNPSFEAGRRVDQLVDEGVLHHECRRIFRINKDAGEGQPLRLHAHQQHAVLVARSGVDFVVTRGTGSGKSLTYVVPAMDHVLRNGPPPGLCPLRQRPAGSIPGSLGHRTIASECAWLSTVSGPAPRLADQDLKAQEIRFLHRLAAKHPGGLMLIGDAGQRIYPGGYSLRSLGIDVRGRSRVLRINYRTTEQIRRFADQVLPESSDDLDGGTESRKGTRSLLHGPTPTVRGFTVAKDQEAFVVTQISQLLGQGLMPREIAAFCRVGARLDPLQQALAAVGIPVYSLGRDEEGVQPDGVHLGTMHRAKGLEYKVVFAYDCTEGVVPNAATLRRCKDPGDYEAARARERQLLYVTLTRARDEAFVTWVGLPSPFLPDENKM